MQSTVSCLPCKPSLMSLGFLEVFSCPPLGTKGGYSAPLYPIISPPLWPMYCYRQEASQDLWGMHYNTAACTSTKWGRLYILGQCFRAHCDKMDSLCIHTNTILCVSSIESGVCVCGYGYIKWVLVILVVVCIHAKIGGRLASAMFTFSRVDVFIWVNQWVGLLSWIPCVNYLGALFMKFRNWTALWLQNIWHINW